MVTPVSFDPHVGYLELLLKTTSWSSMALGFQNISSYFLFSDVVFAGFKGNKKWFCSSRRKEMEFTQIREVIKEEKSTKEEMSFDPFITFFQKDTIQFMNR